MDLDLISEPHVKDLASRGFVRGLTYYSRQPLTLSSSSSASQSPSSRTKSNSSPIPLCHYYGGVRYAFAPAKRWRRARPLPSDFVYGTRHNPGDCTGRTRECPQPGRAHALRKKLKRKLMEEGKKLEENEAEREDVFQCNVWCPLDDEERPEDGWPVFFFIHGGFLQFGTPNTFSAAALLGETDFKCVIVMPAYRVSVFGFLSSVELERDAEMFGEPSGNQGFWDQRMALEWTKENIGYFGGNPDNITIAGYSAGSYSVFYQLAYDLYQPDGNAIIKRAIMWSNGPAMQPKSRLFAQDQFDELLSVLNIPLLLPPADKIAILRSLPIDTILDALDSIKHYHEFRPHTDSDFIQPSLFQDIDNGIFAEKLISRNIRLMIGECRDEHFLYATHRPPQSDTLASLAHRLKADYFPPPAVDKLIRLYYPDGKLPPDCKNWHTDAFGRIYADMQIHLMERGLINALARTGAGHLIYRYRMEFRLKCVDRIFPPEWGATHATDQWIWFWGNGMRMLEREKHIVRKGVFEPLVKFVQGQEDDIGWEAVPGRVKEVRRLREDGEVDVWIDERWDEGVRVWEELKGFGATIRVSGRL
ncbi:hypothetical protein DTO212C5_3383 [Paecilomyces variotii]|nr:hypothetical protein DTO212C5_3383 [Paecilomyces variotii]